MLPGGLTVGLDNDMATAIRRRDRELLLYNFLFTFTMRVLCVEPQQHSGIMSLVGHEKTTPNLVIL